MKRFTVYDPGTGTIIRSGLVARDADAARQAMAGEAVLVGDGGSNTTQRVDITQTPPALVPRIIPPPTLEALKIAAKGAAAQRRWEVETGGMVMDGINVPTDDRSKLLILGAKFDAVADPNFTVRWKTDSGWIPLNAAGMLALCEAVQLHVAQCFAREQELDALIDAAPDAPTLAALEATIQTYWPT